MIVQGNPEGVPLTWVITIITPYISIQLLMDTTNALQELGSCVTARAFAAVTDPAKGHAVREDLACLTAQSSMRRAPLD